MAASVTPLHVFNRYHTIPATETDGKDLRMESIRRDNLGKRLQNSSKYGSPSLRWIAWSIPGTGLTTLVTDLFAARVSECELVRIHSKWLMIFPPGDITHDTQHLHLHIQSHTAPTHAYTCTTRYQSSCRPRFCLLHRLLS